MSARAAALRRRLAVGTRRFDYFSLEAAEASGLGAVSRLPFSLKVLLENLLRHADGRIVTEDDIAALASWGDRRAAGRDIAFHPGRVLMQDSAGLPALADIAAMRDALARWGGDAAAIDAVIPVDLVVDHSVEVDHAGTPDALARNMAIELTRNGERYAFLRWAEQAFAGLRIVKPGNGICHQVNLEHLAPVVAVSPDGATAFPDTLLGTDSHTTMINALGVLGWGCGGIEAAAALLGQPIALRIPEVVGCRLAGRLPEGANATDLVLTVTDTLRRHALVQKFVEFCGPGLDALALPDRATLANMAPEYGATMGFFPIDSETLAYLRLTGRDEAHVALVEAYAKTQGLWRDPAAAAPLYSALVEIDLAAVESSLAGPRRPQDRVALSQVPASFAAALAEQKPIQRLRNSPSPLAGEGRGEGVVAGQVGARHQTPHPPIATAMGPSLSRKRRGKTSLDDAGLHSPANPHPGPPERLSKGPEGEGDIKVRGGFALADGDIVIAAITSCTNTSNPAAMIGAGLLARNAVARGLRAKPWVKTSLAPGSRVVADYLAASGLQSGLDALGFNLVGFGCMSCMGNSGPLDPAVAAAIESGGLTVGAVLSGNRNFEGRIHQRCRVNYLASPALVVAYAIAGSLRIDLRNEPLGTNAAGRPVTLAELWPADREIQAILRASIGPALFRARYRDIFAGSPSWDALPQARGATLAWDAASHYIRRPPFFDAATPAPPPLADIAGARILALLGDGITTDHISPVSAIPPDGPAGRYLIAQGIARADFNSFSGRRLNHDVMARGAFGNIRLRNEMAPGTTGGVTSRMPDGAVMPIFAAAADYRAASIPLVVVAGRDYGAGSARDWAAKGTRLLGVRAVIAESFERIHRANLIGMGVLPLQFPDGVTRRTLALDGSETLDITGIAGGLAPGRSVAARIVRRDGTSATTALLCRLDTAYEVDYYRHGGILDAVLRARFAEQGI
jgi:aconitate hydratase